MQETIMKPSEILSAQLTEYSRDLALFDILDQMAEDISKLKQYVSNAKSTVWIRREWEDEPLRNVE